MEAGRCVQLDRPLQEEAIILSSYNRDIQAKQSCVSSLAKSEAIVHSSYNRDIQAKQSRAACLAESEPGDNAGDMPWHISSLAPSAGCA